MFYDKSPLHAKLSLALASITSCVLLFFLYKQAQSLQTSWNQGNIVTAR